MDTNSYSRRKFLSLVGGMSVVGTFGGMAFAADSKTLTLTPRQTEGPFYPRQKPHDIDNDLAAFGKAESLAKGDLLKLQGRVVDRNGASVSGARVELWHCDEYGQYHHVGARGQLDENFQGYGEILTDPEGHYQFRTIKPGVYPGRARHIHFKVIAPGRRALTSQMYFDGDMASNMRDGIYQRLSVSEREAVTMKTRNSTSASGAEALLDIVVA